MTEAAARECQSTRWGTLTGLDPALLMELQEARRCRQLRAAEAEAEAEAEALAAGPLRLWAARMLAALQRLRR